MIVIEVMGWHGIAVATYFRPLIVQWNPYNVDTFQNKSSVLIIGVSAFQRYGLYAHMLKQSTSMHEKYQNKMNL